MEFVAVKRELVGEENNNEEKDDFGVGLRANEDERADGCVEELFEVLVSVQTTNKLKEKLIECDDKIDRNDYYRSDRTVSFEINIYINVCIPIEQVLN